LRQTLTDCRLSCTNQDMNSYLPDFHKVTKVLIWIIVFIIVGGGGYLLFVSINSLRYSPDNVVKRFVTLIENPTQIVTEAEKVELQDITQSGFIADWGNENNLKTLRRISQNQPINYSPIEYIGQSKRTAQTTLSFQNDLKNPNSKTAVLYLERYGTIATGIRWQIFRINMPQEDTPLDTAKDTLDQVKEDVDKGTENVLDRVKNWFGN
jgi:hypothetical protein